LCVEDPEETYEVKFINDCTDEYWDLFQGTYSECEDFLSTQAEGDKDYLFIELSA
jgi:hypothetical protein